MEERSQIDISLLLRINREISPEKNIDDLYNSMVKISAEVTHSEASSLLLYDIDSNRLHFKSTTATEQVGTGMGIPDDPGVAWHVFTKKETVILNDVRGDERFSRGIDMETGLMTRNIICTPMTARGKIVGVLEVVNSQGRDEYSEIDRSFMEVISIISSSAITNRLLYEDLKKRMEELNALYSLSTAAVVASDVTDFFKRVLGIVAASLNVERASLVFYNRETRRLEITAAYGSDIPEGTAIEDDSIAAYVFRHKKVMNVSNIKMDLPDMLKKKGGGYKSDAFVSIPLFYNGNIVGVLNLTDKKNRRLFDEFELHVLTSIISHVTGIYRNYSNRRNEEKRRRLRQELEIASEIQRKNLSRIPRHAGNITIAVFYDPAREVGGDFFDFYEIKNSVYGFLIADVSGKGIPAAIFTGTVKNILRAERRINHAPASLFNGANKHIYNESEYGMFATAFYIIIDEKSKKLFYSSAGHNEQMLVRKRTGEVMPLKTRGKPLGISEIPGYMEKTTEFENGDILFLFTDGLAEALSDETLDIDVGFENLGKIVLDCIGETPEFILNRVRNAVKESSQHAELADDLTVLALSL